MKDGAGAGEPADNSRGELYDAYVNFHRQLGTKEKATQYLLREPEPRGAFTVFPFYQAVCEGPDSLSRDCRKHLCAFIKATELLETLCVNLFLQPWKKEIKTLKTFTGPFVYCLLPVFSSSTIKSVLASIGYLPHTDTEFRLSEDANPDRAMEVGFEMVLARVECFHLLELLEKDQLGTQVTTYLDTRLSEHPQPKPRSSNVMSVDQSIMEMQRTYPDLVFRGRPLVPDKPHQPPGRRQQQTAAGNTHSDNSNKCFVTYCTKNKFFLNMIFTDALNKSLAKAEPSSLSSVDEEQELRELAQRMGQLHVHEFKEENFRKPVMETGGELSHDAGRHSRSSQSDHTVTEQNQPNMYHPSAVAVTTADCESCKGEGGTGQHEGEDPGRVDAGQRQDQLAHSFVIVEPHKK
uniref:Spermatogenesis-associated protein 2 PUB-like domain-containing protein n=1 Tax=Anabas testudineus TaxID=64144 RepID=A0A3Q1HI31_ANATE